GALGSLAADSIPRGEEIGIDASVIGFAGLLSLATGLLFGFFAATASARVAIASGLREGTRGSSATRRAGTLRNGLAVAQVALALALMTGAGLLANSYYRLNSVETGFSFENVLTARVSVPVERYDTDASILQFFDELTAGVERLPGVTSVTTSYSPPLASSSFRQSIEIDDGPGGEDEDRVWAGTVIVGEGFFDASGIPLVAGRGFGPADRGGPQVAVVNRTMAERYWPGEDAVGKRFRITGGITGSVESLDRRYFVRDWMTVVGVAGDVRRRSLEEPAEPEFYRPHSQMAWPGMAFLIRTTGDPEALVPALKAETARLDRTLPVTSIRTLSQLRAEATAMPRFRTALLGAFAAIASFLAIIGVYGVMSFTVGQQRHEIGIRMALGASHRQVMRRVLGRGLRVAGFGAALGLALAFVGSRALGAMVYGISTRDPLTYVAVTALILGVALAATALPARRASRVDPVGTLREG
ncbi:MAG: FtsX-like permease family protein, partial [Gemmatimonadota bacterium]|nr:FtsX-like permease family protein [Gemmatimonadota bacterium]